MIAGLKTPAAWKPSPYHSKKKTLSSKKKYNKNEKKRKSTIEDIAREAVMFRCSCNKYCLSAVGSTIPESIDMMADYITPWMNMDNKEHKGKFFSILEGCSNGVTPGGHLNKS